MNKSFTKEDDEGDDDEVINHIAPTGGRNYMTPAGAERMQKELYELRYKTRLELTKTLTWAAGNGDRSENADYTYAKRKLREVDRRIRFLSKRLESVEVVDPLKVACDEVRFGATVTVRDEDDQEKVYSIVGIDESDLAKRRISWVSPLGSALLKAKVGDVVTFVAPQGRRELEVLSITYVELS